MRTQPSACRESSPSRRLNNLFFSPESWLSVRLLLLSPLHLVSSPPVVTSLPSEPWLGHIATTKTSPSTFSPRRSKRKTDTKSPYGQQPLPARIAERITARRRRDLSPSPSGGSPIFCSPSVSPLGSPSSISSLDRCLPSGHGALPPLSLRRPSHHWRHSCPAKSFRHPPSPLWWWDYHRHSGPSNSPVSPRHPGRRTSNCRLLCHRGPSRLWLVLEPVVTLQPNNSQSTRPATHHARRPNRRKPTALRDSKRSSRSSSRR